MKSRRELMAGVFSIEVKSVAETNATPQAFFVGILCGNKSLHDLPGTGTASFSRPSALFEVRPMISSDLC
jgi:hypothetical protein